MLILLFTVCVSFLLSSFMIGAFVLILFKNLFQKNNRLKCIIVLFLFIILWNYMWSPAFQVLDVHFYIYNNQIADLLNIKGKLLSLTHYYSFRWYDLILWTFQVSIAYFIGHHWYNQLFIKSNSSKPKENKYDQNVANNMPDKTA
jgi:hypothetical protein